MTSALLPDGHYYIQEGEVIREDDRYWSWSYDEWKPADRIIVGTKAGKFHYIRKITGSYLPKTATEEAW